MDGSSPRSRPIRVDWASGVVSLVLAIGLGTLGPARASGSSYTYSTNGSLHAPPSVTFDAVPGLYSGPGTIRLGDFVVAPPATGTDVTLEKAPFYLGFEIPELGMVLGPHPDGTAQEANQLVAGVTVIGDLTGTVTADGSANLTARVNRIYGMPNHPLPTWLIKSSLPFSTSDLRIDPVFQVTTQAGGGRFPISITVVPEPVPVVLFLAVSVALARLSRLKRRFEREP